MEEAVKGREGKSIEQIYKKMTQLEHVLNRPDTYVGSTETQRDRVWVFDRKLQKMQFKEIDVVPGLYKIFDEILVNAADNFVRDPENMNKVEVEINQEEGYIKILNNGKGVPVQMHAEHNMYVPSLLFGELLTSDNYDDTEKKVTGGRNGYGAKLTNIFSKKFIVETADSSVKKLFRQEWRNNMSEKDEPEISHFPHSADYTEVTFWPDLERFHMEKLEDDIVDFMTKRVFDIAGTSQRGKHDGIHVFLNGKRVRTGGEKGTYIKGFGDYVNMYLKASDPRIHEVANDRWEYCISISDGQFSQVSFTNSICTNKGGTHVAHVTDQVVAAILEKVNSRNKGGMEIKPFHVRNHLMIFVNALVENPAFDSQTKDTLTTKQAKFGSKCEVSEESIQRVLKSGIVDIILHWAKSKQEIDIKRKLKVTTQNTSRCLGIPKLEDANDAGTKNSKYCTLILTEGDSAKSLAVAGLGVVGRNRYGVFPLKGKLLNVRDASFKQITTNAEIGNLFKILGLDQKATYKNGPEGLRYGSVMVMCDQDLDGSHIKGLLMNLFQAWWPNLFKHEGFLKEFATPIVKVSKGGTTKEFFTLKEYDTWKAENDDGRGWKSKYYKGLGTSTSAEAKQYFKRMAKHQIVFGYSGTDCDEAIDLAFNKKRTDDRKGWINGANDEDFVDHTQGTLTYSDFVSKELVQFSKYDVVRSIPSMVDGFKPTQRKCLFAAIKRKLHSDVKVAQFVGYTSEQTSYHHGEASLETTIVGMAQDFVGSNNVNLFFPSGQFGTRAMGGKDAASSRYIFTRLNKIARTIFHPSDDAVLEYLNDEGHSIEPRYYVPVIPMVLCNGGDGIGTGWSCSVPNYNPRDVLENCRRLLKGEELQPMHPHYAGYGGDIVAKEKGQYDVVGKIEKTSATTVDITELPVKVWTQDYKEWLQDMLPKDETKVVTVKEGEEPPPPQELAEDEIKIEDLREFHTENTVHFSITLSAEMMQKAEECGLEKIFRIRKTGLAITNMVLFDSDGRVSKYIAPEEIMNDFAAVRMQFYHKRKTHLCEKLLREKSALDFKMKFLNLVLDDKLVVYRRKKADLVAELRTLKFPTMKQIQKLTLDTDLADLGDEVYEDGEEDDPNKESGYNYLLGMPLWNLTYEKVEEMDAQRKEKAAEFDVLMQTTPESMWWVDLAAVSDALEDLEAGRAKVLAKALAFQEKAKAKLAEQDKRAAELAEKLAAEKAAKEEAAKLEAEAAKDGDAGEPAAEAEPEKKKAKGKGKGKGRPSKAEPEMDPEAEAQIEAQSQLAAQIVESDSEEEPEEAQEEKKKGKKKETVVVPELPTFVAKPRVVHEFSMRSKFSLKKEEKKKQRKPLGEREEELKKVFAGPEKPKGPNGESQAEMRERRIAEREAAKKAADAEKKMKEAAREAAREAAKLEAAKLAAAAPKDMVADAENVDPSLGVKRVEPPVAEKATKRARGLRA